MENNGNPLVTMSSGTVGLGELVANCISPYLGITLVASVFWLSSSRVGLGGFQTQFQVSWIYISRMALGTTHPEKPRPLFTYSL